LVVVLIMCCKGGWIYYCWEDVGATMVNNVGKCGYLQKAANMLDLKSLSFWHLHVEYVFHDELIIHTFRCWAPWVVKNESSIDPMKELSKLVQPSSSAPWNGMGIFQDRMRQT